MRAEIQCRSLLIALSLSMSACYGTATRSDGKQADGDSAKPAHVAPDGAVGSSGSGASGSSVRSPTAKSDAGKDRSPVGTAGTGKGADAGKDAAIRMALDAGRGRDPEPDPEPDAGRDAGRDAGVDASAPSVDAALPNIDFAAACARNEETLTPSCVECNSAASGLECFSQQAAFSRECAAAERCFTRNCGALCSAGPCPERCECMETCVPTGESRCKQLWSALLACVADQCLGTC